LKSSVSEYLRRSAPRAVEAIGDGLVRASRSNPGLLDPSGSMLQQILDESITAVFRLLFGFYAEARALTGLDNARRTRLFDPALHELLSKVEIPDRSIGRALDLLGPSAGIDYSNIDLREFGAVYETLLEYAPDDSVPTAEFRIKRRRESRRKRSGSYYTPRTVVAYIVESTLGPLLSGRCRPEAEAARETPLSADEILTLKIADPAMGSGHFLMEAVDWLARAYRRALAHGGRDRAFQDPQPAAEDRRLIAERCVYGVDVNQTAVEIAELSLQLFASVPGKPLPLLEPHLKRGDSLRGATFTCGYDGGPGSFDWASEFAEVAPGVAGSTLSHPGFDAVIGNPPYLSFSGRQKPGRSGAAGEDRPHVALAATHGRWPSLHGAFMTRSLELVRERGLVSMIVPAQVGHLSGYGRLRSRIMESGDLLEVRYWGEEVFDGVTTPSLTFLSSRGHREPERSTLVIDEGGKGIRFRPRGDDLWYSSPSRKACEQLRERHPTLETFSDPGVHTGNVAARIILKEPRAGAVRVLEGRRVHPFRCDAPDRWLDKAYEAREGEYFRIGPERVYVDTDIVLRQTAGRPIAARHIYRCHFRNSVLALRVSEPFSVEYLLGVLNSDAAGWIYASLCYEARQRSFPQVKVHALKNVPIPDPSAPLNRGKATEIGDIVRLVESQQVPERTLLEDLNQVVWAIYGVEPRPVPLPA
jgi:hypothetical protein